MKSAVAGLVAGAGLLSGCWVSVDLGDGKTVEATETFEFPAGDAKVLVVEGAAGSIVAGPPSKKGTVRVVATKRARTEEDLARIRVSAAVEGGEVRVGYTVEGSSDRISVAFAVEAPSDLRARLRSGAGSIEARCFEKGLEARTGAGSIRTGAVHGDLVLETGAGSVHADGAAGTVRAETGAGSIEVEGRIRGDSSLVTRAGSVDVTLPADSRLRVEGRTSAGSARSDFPLEVEGSKASKGLHGTLGDGGEGSLRIETSAGSVTVRRAP